MTLLIRLACLAVLGVALFFGYVAFGEPRLKIMAAQQATEQAEHIASENIQGFAVTNLAQLTGQYAAKAANGTYGLLLDQKGAEMLYTDTKGQRYAYRGHYVIDRASLTVNWAEQRVNGTWTGMQVVEDRMTVVAVGEISAHGRSFKRTKANLGFS